MWFFSVFFNLFIVNYDEGIARESFSFKIILRSPWYNHLSSNVSMIIIYCGLLDDNFPPSQLDLSIVQSFLLPNWSHPPILVDTISRGVTMVKTYFEQCTLGFIFFITIYFSWNVISKKYFSLTVMRSLSPTQRCVSGNFCKQASPEIPEVTCAIRTIMGVLYETSLIWAISLGWNYG